MTSSEIQIDNLNKAEVLAALYNASKPQGMGMMAYDPTWMSIDEADTILCSTTNFDYLKGRVMKVNLSGNSFDPYLYDRDNGEGAAERVISQIKKGRR